MGFATLDANNQIVGFTEKQVNWPPERSRPGHPAPWRSVPFISAPQPQVDTLYQTTDNSYVVNPNDVTEVWTIRDWTPAESDYHKDKKVNQLDRVAMQVAFNHENRIRALESKAPITKQQFITALKGLL